MHIEHFEKHSYALRLYTRSATYLLDPVLVLDDIQEHVGITSSEHLETIIKETGTLRVLRTKPTLTTIIYNPPTALDIVAFPAEDIKHITPLPAVIPEEGLIALQPNEEQITPFNLENTNKALALFTKTNGTYLLSPQQLHYQNSTGDVSQGINTSDELKAILEQQWPLYEESVREFFETPKGLATRPSTHSARHTFTADEIVNIHPIPAFLRTPILDVHNPVKPNN